MVKNAVWYASGEATEAVSSDFRHGEALATIDTTLFSLGGPPSWPPETTTVTFTWDCPDAPS